MIKPLQTLALGLVLTLTLTFGPELDNKVKFKTVKYFPVFLQDFCRTPILSDEVFKLMDKNNDGQISKVLNV